MESKRREVVRWHVRCAEGHAECTTYENAGDGYGDFMGRTRRNELAEFNAWEDATLDEVSAILGQVLRSMGRDGEVATCLPYVLGMACDPAPSGQQYSFSAEMWCPTCERPAASNGPDVPRVIEVVDLPQVTHREWQGLSSDEKIRRIDEGILQSGCLKAP